MTIGNVEMVVGRQYLVGGLHGSCDRKMKDGVLLLAKCAAVNDAVDGCNAYVELEVEGLEEVVGLWFGRTNYYTMEGWHGVDDMRIDSDEIGAVIVEK